MAYRADVKRGYRCHWNPASCKDTMSSKSVRASKATPGRGWQKGRGDPKAEAKSARCMPSAVSAQDSPSRCAKPCLSKSARSSETAPLGGW
eukprot:2039234-Alexandrium_andersonii.AAC.1